MNNQKDILVSVCSVTYNHAPYIRQCLDGILMQKTSFKYEVLVHDDCSTDGTTDILREYAAKYPDLIVPIYQSVNQYQNGNTSILKTFVYPIAKGKYYAICEGDDYWTDSLKLQKQVDFMEKHPECTMTCTRALLYSAKENRYVGEQYCRNTAGFINPCDIIKRTGLYIATCSMVFRPEIIENYPDYCQNCNVGDYPLKIMASMKGSVFYFNDIMCVYRIDNNGSWFGQQKFNTIDPARLHIVGAQVKMFEGFSENFSIHKEVFIDKISEHICKNMPHWRSRKDDFEVYQKMFSSIIDSFSFKWKFCYLINKLRIPMVSFLFKKCFLHEYYPLKKCYEGYVRMIINRYTNSR